MISQTGHSELNLYKVESDESLRYCRTLPVFAKIYCFEKIKFEGKEMVFILTSDLCLRIYAFDGSLDSLIHIVSELNLSQVDP